MFLVANGDVQGSGKSCEEGSFEAGRSFTSFAKSKLCALKVSPLSKLGRSSALQIKSGTLAAAAKQIVNRPGKEAERMRVKANGQLKRVVSSTELDQSVL